MGVRRFDMLVLQQLTCFGRVVLKGGQHEEEAEGEDSCEQCVGSGLSASCWPLALLAFDEVIQ